ncbi:MAG: SPOR domain-containing protein, partial [Methylobacter sp.]
IAPVKEKAKQEAAPAKQEVTPTKVEAASESVPAKAKIQPEAVSAKPVTSPKVVVKEEPVKASQQAATAGKWGVNLVAFKQEWFAKSKAAEFARLGVFAEVIPVHEGNSTMYRLRVSGFRSKAEAFSNTDRIKKTLNLDSVWVSDN